MIINMWIICDLLFIIYALAYLPYLLFSRRAYPGYSMRFGFIPLGLRETIRRRENIWVHAVSVGEVIVIDELITRLNELYPKYQIVATVTTKAGYALAQNRLAGKAVVLPSPLDFSLVVRRFLRLIKPKIYVAAETEIWPNLFLALEARRIPAIIINGRISDASYGRYKMIRWALKPILQTIDIAGMQSELDAQRISFLGAESSAVKVLGNIKFDDVPEACQYNLADYGFDPNTLLFIAGSTRPGEEEIMLKAYQSIVKTDQNWHLVLAPRHIERAQDVVALVRDAGFEVLKFSELNTKQHQQQAVIVVDTIGHLRSLYALANIVFVGNSLRHGGGHNIIEPAFFAKPVIVGPLMFNFRDIMRCFREGNGIVEVKDADHFHEILVSLASDVQLRHSWGQRARNVVRLHQGTTSRTIELLKKWL